MRRGHEVNKWVRAVWRTWTDRLPHTQGLSKRSGWGAPLAEEALPLPIILRL